MAGNDDLHQAKKAKKDEFYTQLQDIENELKNYKEFFKGKTVFCNCDDPYESDFFKYFAMNFNHLGLKKLICTSYTGSPIVGEEFSDLPLFRSLNSKKAYKVEITEVYDENGDGAINMTDVDLLLKNMKNKMELLKGDGDFRSQECIELLKESDIVVTNPPFSLFSEFLEQLIKFKKDFVIIGNTNALSYKEVFQLFQKDGIRTGYTKFNVGMFFRVPDYWEKYTKIENGVKMARVSTSCWLTSLPVKKHNDELTCYKEYNPQDYPRYDNYDAINIDKYTDIPKDYYGVMGVPITFLDKYNPNQFEIIDINPHFFNIIAQGLPKPKQLTLHSVGRKDPYARILIKRKDSNENRTPQN